MADRLISATSDSARPGNYRPIITGMPGDACLPGVTRRRGDPIQLGFSRPLPIPAFPRAGDSGNLPITGPLLRIGETALESGSAKLEGGCGPFADAPGKSAGATAHFAGDAPVHGGEASATSESPAPFRVYLPEWETNRHRMGSGG